MYTNNKRVLTKRNFRVRFGRYSRHFLNTFGRKCKINRQQRDSYKVLSSYFLRYLAAKIPASVIPYSGSNRTYSV